MNDPTKKLNRPSIDALTAPKDIPADTPPEDEDNRSTFNQKPFNATLTHGMAKQLTEPSEQEINGDTASAQDAQWDHLAFNETISAPTATQQHLTSPFHNKTDPHTPLNETLNINALRAQQKADLPQAMTIQSNMAQHILHDQRHTAQSKDAPKEDALSTAQTIVNTPSPTDDPELGETLVQTLDNVPAPPTTAKLSSLSEVSSLNQTARLTSLPSVIKMEGRPELDFDSRERYQKMGALGEGGMGDVMLVQDDDIDRRVAMKRLKRADSDSLLRFIDEIRTIGKLEHPNIIPIHDVGVDQDGSYFFIMKHVEGETLESMIEKLRNGDVDAHRKYTFDVRIQIFLNILQAISFAHAQNIIHRDIKPANIMVGQHGEVTVMDWGLAKPLDRTEEEANKDIAEIMDTLERNMLENKGTNLSIKQRLRLTQQGELLGTPAYMSPEQAQGHIDQIDKRTDTYALSVMFYEMMTLNHYLEDKQSLITMLHGVIHDEATFAAFVDPPNQSRVPAEVAHFIKRGMLKDINARYQDSDEMIFFLQQVIDGTFAVECPVTFMKSTNNKLNRALDQNPWPVILSASFLALLLTSSVVFSIYSLVSST